MNKGWECTNLHGIFRASVNDHGVSLVMIYDNGDRYEQCIEFPHMVKGYPALRGKWRFITRMKG